MKLPAILKNKYVLYVVLFFAITNVLGFLQRKDFESLTIFITIGVLSTYFSKNMTVNLLIALVGSNVIRGSGLVREGFEEGATGKPLTKEEKKKKKAEEKRMAALEKKCKAITDGTDPDKAKCLAADEGCQWNANTTTCSAKETFGQRNVPSSKPASVSPATEGEEDEALGKRIDYAATLEQAYDNLEKMLGSDGLKGLTNETKHLVGQQKNLMKTLNSMAPVLNNAKETLSNLNLPDMKQVQELMSTLQGSKK